MAGGRLPAGAKVPAGPLAITEKVFTQQVTDLARHFGWTTYHPYLSVRSTPGWPDMAIVRPPRFILAELKTDKGKLSPQQEKWLHLLGQCPGIEVYEWRPRDYDEIVQVLR